jgi:glycosyltransferase involved in cell wall biosynthesis
MKILVTGKYEPEYNRNHVLLKGLESLGIELIKFPYTKRNKFSKKKIKELEKDCDIIFLPSFTHLDVPFVRKISVKPLVFDPLISRYLSKVFDYKAVWKYSPRALRNYLKDSRAFSRSDLILADTHSHKDYYVTKFGVEPAKIAVVHVGVNSADFYPKKVKSEQRGKFIVGFYGSFIPLHGIEKIIAAAKILEKRDDLEFRIYGNGPGFEKIRELTLNLGLRNTILAGWVDYKSLNDVINEMDICLGIFGESLKAELVIPNKIYHYSACSKAIITADTKGIREIFEDGKNIILIRNSSAALAKSIESLADNQSLRTKIAENACQLISKEYNEKKIALEFLKGIEKILPVKVFASED